MRKIHRGLGKQVFQPRAWGEGPREPVCLTLDGLEALRLADLEGLYQEEAARRMGVSRATFARVLSTARGAVADALVHGKSVRIDGGPVEPRRRSRWPCPVHGGERRQGRGCHCSAKPGDPFRPAGP